ncbi:hypothetical protein E2C01_096185 [Portunus trituberculatus]|uniref:Uncharacterized protein n=1 Tax=Portunus trituberculatus TaxID=210409 RepID=A0A5B7JXB3_PORTR|nr:hypothetical protein [Portunus trituberculatus]
MSPRYQWDSTTGCDSSVHGKDVFVEDNDPFIEVNNDVAMAMAK